MGAIVNTHSKLKPIVLLALCVSAALTLPGQTVVTNVPWSSKYGIYPQQRSKALMETYTEPQPVTVPKVALFSK
jgi:hypothetical protein